MILSKEVEVILNPANVPYYESLGYLIPRVKKYYKLSIPRGTKIKVQVEDLSKGSNTKILCECDKCHKQRTVNFCHYYKLCKVCADKEHRKENAYNWKGGLPHCRNCGKELSLYTAEYCVSCKYLRLVGEKNPNYNPNLTQDERENKRYSISPWKRKVKQRDKFTCQKCGSKKNPQAHHINSYSAFSQERLDENNGVCLCKDCHKQLHQIFGMKTTRKDFEAFMKL